jgi:phosphoribosylformimino-5-aminoimidazole carboxamide ribonucleotide (ProFAR) isomerase
MERAGRPSTRCHRSRGPDGRRSVAGAGGIDGPEQIELAFAAGATRVVMPLWAVADDRVKLADCLRIAGDWLAVGLDGRPERLRDFPWQQREPPRLEDLVVELTDHGVRRLVLSHGGASPDLCHT